MRHPSGSGTGATGAARTIRSLSWRRALFVLPIAVAAILVSVSVTGAAVMRRAAPAAALRVAPHDAQAMAAAAAMALGENDRGQLDRGAALAKQALQRDPTVVSAWRVLAIVAAAQGRPDEATKLMDFASHLSRRDLPTQLWLIEDKVRRNDVIGALRHYDKVLRTSENGIELLMPTLVASISHNELVEPVAELLASDPPWLPHFFSTFGASAPGNENTAKLLELLRSNGYQKEIPYADLLPARLVTLGEYRTAARVHTALFAPRRDARSAGDQFGRTLRVPPFDWDLAAAGGIRSEPQMQDESDAPASLHVFGEQGNSGVAASKLFVLAPGRYRLLTEVRNQTSSAPERLNWTIHCAESSELIATIDIASKAEGRRAYAVPFDVPASGCAAQWLRLVMRAVDGPDPSEAWIDGLEVRRR